jgi:hypothetical protein
MYLEFYLSFFFWVLGFSIATHFLFLSNYKYIIVIPLATFILIIIIFVKN